MAIPSSKQPTNGTTTYSEKVMDKLNSGYNSFVLPYAKVSDRYLGGIKRKASTYDAALSKYPLLKVFFYALIVTAGIPTGIYSLLAFFTFAGSIGIGVTISMFVTGAFLAVGGFVLSLFLGLAFLCAAAVSGGYAIAKHLHVKQS
ncbi:hypothetical protein SeMB42_g05413 [Synchytrium endobioticum]|uniref:Uncharacterized protein n=1 Tax=Synchytrium endobioticum TaxID=286115 RepID=A0A507CIY0_9FUNG|nr:hypothetical protein SeLEV6574_g07154 [Synchytrium endobioticum]TPX41783.1 hypothetical protein SeMB42_g05413 [Synchytrium endobioticum]